MAVSDHFSMARRVRLFVRDYLSEFGIAWSIARMRDCERSGGHRWGPVGDDELLGPRRTCGCCGTSETVSRTQGTSSTSISAANGGRSGSVYVPGTHRPAAESALRGEVSGMGNIGRCNQVADGLRASLKKMARDGDEAMRRGYEREQQLRDENDALRDQLGGAVSGVEKALYHLNVALANLTPGIAAHHEVVEAREALRVIAGGA